MDKKETARALGEILETGRQGDPQETRKGKPLVWIQRRVSPLVAEKIRKAELTGSDDRNRVPRFYPLKSFAAQAVGFAGLDSSGLEGWNSIYDQDLKVDPILLPLSETL